VSVKWTRKNEKNECNKKSSSRCVYTEQINKIALSAEDDKKIVLSDRIHTLAYGHWNSQMSQKEAHYMDVVF